MSCSSSAHKHGKHLQLKLASLTPAAALLSIAPADMSAIFSPLNLFVIPLNDFHKSNQRTRQTDLQIFTTQGTEIFYATAVHSILEDFILGSRKYLRLVKAVNIIMKYYEEKIGELPI